MSALGPSGIRPAAGAPALALVHRRRRRRLRRALAGRSDRASRLLRRRRLCRRGCGAGVGGGAGRGGRGIIRRLNRVVLNLFFDRPQFGDVLLVLIVRVAKGVATGTIRDEEQIAGARRVGGGFERSAAGIGDRPRRKTVNHIGVVGRRLLDFAALDRPSQRSLAADQPVNDGRIGLQLYFLPQPVDEHRRDTAALVGLAGLLLDDRGQRNQLLRRLDWKVLTAALPDFHQRALLRLLHARNHLFAGGAAREFVGFRQQRALARHFADGT